MAGQSWSPDVDSPPFYAHLPFRVDPGVPHLVPNEPYHSMWEANMPLYMAEEHVDELRALRGIRFDSAFEDEFTHIPETNRRMSRKLTELGIEHTFEMYNGDHRNRLNGFLGRLGTEVFPYFSALLEGASSPRTPRRTPPRR